MNVALWKVRFREYLELRRFAPRTIEGYVGELDRFFAYLEASGIESLGEITRDAVEGYREHLFGLVHRGRRLTVGTQAGRLSSVKAFTRFLRKANFLLTDPGIEVEMPRVPRSLPHVLLTEEDTVRVIEATDTSSALGIRDRAILEVLYCTGVRNTELCSLALDDVSLERRELRVRCGKGGKGRVVPLGEETLIWLTEYLRNVRPCVARSTSEPLVFLTYRGSRLERVDLSRIVRAAARAAGLDVRVTPHLIRHCCATHMLRGGAGIRQLQQLLGHESPATTERYTRLELSDLRRVHAACHPRERGRIE